MKFLKTLLSAFSRSSAAAKPTDRPKQPLYVRPGANVARFVFERRDFMQDGRPKPRAFTPDFHPELKRYEVSVCGLHGVPEERMWHLGRTIRAGEGKAAIAALTMPVDQIVATGLDCQPAPEPETGFLEHGVITGWNPDPDAKSARLDLQQELAALVPLSAVLRPL